MYSENNGMPLWIKGSLITLAVIGIALLLFFTVVPISYNNSAARLEQLVIYAKDDCISIRDNGIKAIIEMAQVQTNSQDALAQLINAKGEAQVNSAYEQFVNGDPAPFMLMMSTIGSTDFTATAQNVQREISSQRGAMKSCAASLNGAKLKLKTTLGMDASGRVVAFPQKYFNLRYPSPVNDETLFDNDGDGLVTVLDYTAPVSIKVSESFGTGVDNETITIYPTPAP